MDKRRNAGWCINFTFDLISNDSLQVRSITALRRERKTSGNILPTFAVNVKKLFIMSFDVFDGTEVLMSE